MSDWNAHGQLPGCTVESCPQAINAGLDMYMAPDSWRPLYKNLLQQARDGVVPTSRLDDAVARILRVKARMGLFEAGLPSKRPGAGQFGELGSSAHRAVAREAVRKSLVLLKNENGLLPLKPAQRVLVAGDGADNIGKQSGGWTITWQGAGLDNSRFPGATSVWKGIQAAVAAAGGTAELSVEGKYSSKPDVAIVVFGENPYAEFPGRHLVADPSRRQRWAPRADAQAARGENPGGGGVPFGRPLWMNREINASTAFVAAWLPGSEGAGIADVLYRKKDGSVAYDFSGRLPFSGRAPCCTNRRKPDSPDTTRYSRLATACTMAKTATFPRCPRPPVPTSTVARRESSSTTASSPTLDPGVFGGRARLLRPQAASERADSRLATVDVGTSKGPRGPRCRFGHQGPGRR